MDKQPSIKKNYIMNTALTMSSFVFPLITFPYVSRVLLPVGTGKVAFAVSVISYFTLFAQLGIPTYGVRACAKVRDNRMLLTKTAHELVMISVIMSMVAYVGLAIVLMTIPRLREDYILYIIVSITIILSSIGMEWLFKALEQYTYIAMRSIIFKLIAIVAMFVMIHSQDDYYIYGGISVFAASASNILNLIHARKFIDFKRVSSYDLKQHFAPIMVFFATACAVSIYTNLDEVMLGFMTTDVEVGYYDAATKVKKVLVSIVTSLGVVVLPRASYYIEKGQIREFWEIGSKAIHFTFIIACPLAVFFGMYATETIFVLAGKAYENAILPMIILMPILLFIGLTSCMGIQIMVPLGKENQVLFSVIIGAVVDAAVNLLLIPRYGATGAAIGTALAEFSVVIYQFFCIKKNVKSAYMNISYWKIILALIASAILSHFICTNLHNNLLILMTSATIFFVTYLVILFATKEEMTREIFHTILEQMKGR